MASGGVGSSAAWSHARSQVQRVEQVSAQHDREGLPGHLFDQRPEDPVVEVVVVRLPAALTLDAAGLDEVQDVVDRPLAVEVAGHADHLLDRVEGEAALHPQDLTDGRTVAGERELHVLGDVRVQVDVPSTGQQHHLRRDERLGDARDGGRGPRLQRCTHPVDAGRPGPRPLRRDHRRRGTGSVLCLQVRVEGRLHDLRGVLRQRLLGRGRPPWCLAGEGALRSCRPAGASGAPGERHDDDRCSRHGSPAGPAPVLAAPHPGLAFVPDRLRRHGRGRGVEPIDLTTRRHPQPPRPPAGGQPSPPGAGRASWWSPQRRHTQPASPPVSGPGSRYRYRWPKTTQMADTGTCHLPRGRRRRG